jgi:hypothetical protein
MHELYAVLMSWAVTLSGYAEPATRAEVVSVPASYLAEHACGGRPCKVLGWFPPGNRMYLDERLDPRNDLFAASVLVHEMVHFLQYESGRHTGGRFCEDVIRLEREAYAVQREFLLRYGVYRPVGASMHHVGCELAAQAAEAPAPHHHGHETGH